MIVKGLEALQKLKQNNIDNSHLFDDELLNTIEKSLKALEIIIEKRVDVAMFFENNNSVRHRKKLTPQEYDLLKEVLL